VSVRAAEHAVVVTVVNSAGTGPASAPAGAGHGLVGMRQRTALFGGELAAGPTPGGGWSVTAAFPVEHEVEAPA
jgi:signal transduction histidine kinase